MLRNEWKSPKNSEGAVLALPLMSDMTQGKAFTFCSGFRHLKFSSDYLELEESIPPTPPSSKDCQKNKITIIHAESRYTQAFWTLRSFY